MDRPLYKVLQEDLDLYDFIWPSKLSHIFIVLAEEVEQRGARGDDIDWAETAEWLREQALLALEKG